ncbi:hypothetical protein [Micromonospora sp. NPDC049645]|uniref:hypothetical protein n=1 Tax=Micromonospora sp. NPDC049645 TaxID=3155508 RepID=UPI00341BB922
MSAGELLLGAGPDGGRQHVVLTGFAACTPLPIPVQNRRRASLVPGDQRCNRAACRQRWQSAPRPRPAAAGDVEHVCPTCACERDRAVKPCPSCGSPYAAEPA